MEYPESFCSVFIAKLEIRAIPFSKRVSPRYPFAALILLLLIHHVIFFPPFPFSFYHFKFQLDLEARAIGIQSFDKLPLLLKFTVLRHPKELIEQIFMRGKEELKEWVRMKTHRKKFTSAELKSRKQNKKQHNKQNKNKK
jgi:hypothetical protein